MPQIDRAMTREGNKPKLGSTARTLGVRVPPACFHDIPVDPDGTVAPRTGGMSVAPAWRALPLHRIPRRLRHLVPWAAGNDNTAMKLYEQNPHYVRYVALLEQLHALIRDGRGDGPEADSLREQMDQPWHHLSSEETARAREISAELTSVASGKDTCPTRPPASAPGSGP